MNPGNSQTARRIGVLLAAGRGGRMGRTKQLMPWPTAQGDKPLVAAAFDAVADLCDQMVVVLGHAAQAVAKALGHRRFHSAQSSADAEMFESIRAGLAKAQRIDASAEVLLQPADHPEVQPATVQALIEARADHPRCAVMPVYNDKGGHPVLIPAEVIDRLLTASGKGGLRQYWRGHPDQCLRLAVDDPGVVRDLDTLDQYPPGNDQATAGSPSD